MWDDVEDPIDPDLRPYVFLLATASMLGGPTGAQIRSYLEGRKPEVIEFLVESLAELVKLGALEKRGDRYFVTFVGDALLKDLMPAPDQQYEYVKTALTSFQRSDGGTIEDLAKRFGASQNDTLFKALIARFVEMGILELRDGRYYVSEHAKQKYQVSRIN